MRRHLTEPLVAVPLLLCLRSRLAEADEYQLAAFTGELAVV